MNQVLPLILAIIMASLILMMFTDNDIIEPHRGHGGRGHPHGPGSQHGRGWLRWGRRGRGWNWGGGTGWGRGWRYSQPVVVVSNPDPYIASYNCRNGCVNTGDGWGCQYPGWGNNDCWFASDCDGCGGRRSSWWWF
jgi:hypothetical protein